MAKYTLKAQEEKVSINVIIDYLIFVGFALYFHCLKLRF